MTIQLPPILTSYSAFRQHVEGQLLGLQGHDKGDPWQEFVKKFMPLTDFGRRFTNLRDNTRKTRDRGWDISGTTTNANNEVIYIQSKYTVADVNELESVIASWVALAGVPEGQMPLEGMRTDNMNTYFALVTMSDLRSNIVQRYRDSRKPGSVYFKLWEEDNRVAIIDGPQIWKILRDNYLRAFAGPKSQTLTFSSSHVHFSNVYLGVVAVSEIRRIHNDTGDAIFFENVRDFLGDSDVNQEIAKTIQKSPHRLLEMNNGIVFSASDIEEVDNHTLKLQKASIVNGCQTTLSIVKTEPAEEAYVQVKVVRLEEQNEGWQVTKAANFQNEIKRIDLNLATYIRPQVVRRQGYWSGTPVGGSNILDILDTFNRQSVTYRNIRILFIGLFSRDPGNMFDVQWDLVDERLLSHYFQTEERQRRIFDIVFDLHLAAERAVTSTKEAFEDDPETINLFSRLLGDTRAPYKQYLIILAACALTNMNIADRVSGGDEIRRMDQLLSKFQAVFANQQRDLDDTYLIAFEKTAGSVEEEVHSDDIEDVRRKMHNRITKQAKFSSLFRQVKMGLVSAKRMKEHRD